MSFLINKNDIHNIFIISINPPSYIRISFIYKTEGPLVESTMSPNFYRSLINYKRVTLHPRYSGGELRVTQIFYYQFICIRNVKFDKNSHVKKQ